MNLATHESILFALQGAARDIRHGEGIRPAPRTDRILITPIEGEHDALGDQVIRALQVAFAPFGSLAFGGAASNRVAEAMLAATTDAACCADLSEALISLGDACGSNIPALIWHPAYVGIITPTSETRIALHRYKALRTRVTVTFPTPSLERAAQMADHWDSSIGRIEFEVSANA